MEQTADEENDENYDSESENEIYDIFIATKQGNYSDVEYFLNRGYYINAQNKRGWTPLHIASYYGHDQIMKLLLQNGAKIEAIQKDSETPLHCAARQHKSEVVNILINEGANVNHLNKNSLTPLDIARQKNNPQVLEIIAKYHHYDNYRKSWLLFHNALQSSTPTHPSSPLYTIAIITDLARYVGEYM